jgi:hypothetical protein
MASRRFAWAASGPRDRWRHPGVLGRADGGGGAGGGWLRGDGPTPSAPPPSSSLPKTTLTACTVEGLYAECGYVWVPQDRTHPDGPAMPLQVVVLPVA